MKKVVVITGVSREMGLGFETAKQMKEAGYEVIISARRLEDAQKLAGQIGVIAKELDVTDDESVSKLAKEIESDYGYLTTLINNAGAFFDQGNTIMETEIQYAQDALNLNLLGSWRMAKAFVPLLDKSGEGRIVHISSVGGSFSDTKFGLAYHESHVPVYGICKLALNGFTVKLAKELHDSTIKVNSVCPGFIATYPGTEEWGARPVSEGAKGVVWAATLPADGPTGGFFRDGKPLPW